MAIPAETLSPAAAARDAEPSPRDWSFTRWLAAGSGPTVPDQPAHLLHDLISRQALATPDATAVVSEDRSLSYAHLESWANSWAARLRDEYGVGRGQIVAVCAPRSVELSVALLAILKSGAAYLPIAVDCPDERARYMLEESRAAVVLAPEPLGRRFAGTLPVVPLDGEPRRHEPVEFVRPGDSDPTDPAYVIYTSGSTGRPKGAVLSHAGVVNRLLWMRRAYDIRATDRILQKTPYTFDVSVWEFFLPLLSGATLVSARPEGHHDPRYLSDLIRREAITIVHFVPAMLTPFLDEPGVGGCGSLRHVFCSGEALPRHTQDRCLDLLDTELHNLYGPTEASIDVTAWTCQRDDSRRYVPIGRPIDNMFALVLDEDLRPVPDGQVGELYLGGVGLATGYLARSELTREVFLPSPLPDGPDRIYRTGDLVRRHPDGELEYCGRRDRQVKVRGFRIELGEVESRLCDVPEVVEAIVSTEKTSGGADRLIAFLRLRPGATVSLGGLRDALAVHLPEYMIPSSIRLVDRVPVTANGKADLPALHRTAGPPLAAEAPWTAPRDETEQTLVDLWATVLDVYPVGVHDDFFELGGDSLLGLRVISLARDAGLRLTTDDLFTLRTVARLAPIVQGRQVLAVDQEPAYGTAPLTPIQRRFLEYDMAVPDHWSMPLVLDASDPIDVPAARTALHAVLAHHDALRTRLDATGTQTIRPIAPDAPLDVVEFGVGSDRHAQLTAWITTASGTLDVGAGRLVRAAVLRHSEGDRLVLALHHVVMDGVSWRVLADDLDAAYRAARAGRPADLPARTNSILDWARALTPLTAGPALAADRRYWSTQYSPPAGPQWPGPGTGTSGSARRHTATLAPATTQHLLRDTTRVLGARIDEVLVAALWLAVRENHGTEGLFIDLEGHGRDHLTDDLDVSRTVGWFTSIFPVHFEASADAGPLEVLRAVRARLRRIPHRGSGYGMLRYQAADPDLRAELAALPTPTVKFNYLGRFDDHRGTALTVAPVQVALDSAERNVRSHRLDVVGLVSTEGLRTEWEHVPELDDPVTVRNLASAFNRHLHAFCDAADETQRASGDIAVDPGRLGLDAGDLSTIAAAIARIDGGDDDAHA